MRKQINDRYRAKQKIKIANYTKEETILMHYKRYKLSAKKRKLRFDLSIDDFSNYWNNKCYYCHDKIQTIGVDRYDNSQGYTVFNCVPCCTHCNMGKWRFNALEFIEHCKKIAMFHK